MSKQRDDKVMSKTTGLDPAEDLDHRSIVLVGLMGAGKSSVGRRLATELGLPFKDADTEIEKASNLSVAEFFERHGEEAFRKGERQVIARLLTGPRQVLATGGGAYMDEDTRTLIAEKGISVWLRAELDVLYKRCMKRNNRPLLKKGNPRKILKDLMDERYPIYGLADLTADSGEGPHEIVVGKIVSALASLPKHNRTASDQ
ncbi:shikimate kinase [Sneathiella marina]|uniref:Shikimate kinase n=1 Tax=Sneathiella marina TaxID=2950108 RepID=A0ABY4W4J4_9PROT|nr:shikimate kinase [Sneathiella marina]USG62113.1 shikimate kinase [Sneathiella marina]